MNANNTKNPEVISLPSSGVSSNDDIISRRDPLEIALEQIEKREVTFRRILELAIKSTHKGQWVDLGGKPWPTGPAAECGGN